MAVTVDLVGAGPDAGNLQGGPKSMAHEGDPR